MIIELKRIARKEGYTIGVVFIDGVYFCDSLEDKDRGLVSSMPEKIIRELKVWGKTAIPTGEYRVRWTYSARFDMMMPLVDGVKGFTGIRIHSGNTANHTDGCILLGKNERVGMVLESRETCKAFYLKVETAIRLGEPVTIKIS